MEVTSFTSRRPAAGSLPAFSLPPPTSEIPRAGDGLSPSISSVHTGSSQGSQTATNMQYTYGGHVNSGWPTPGGSSYSVSSGPQQSLGHNGYGGRPSMYSQPSMSYGVGQRSSQSPATGGEGFPAPPYDQVHPSYQNSLSNGAAPGGHEHHSAVQAGSLLGAHNSSQPPTPATAPAHVDSYTHTARIPSVATPNYASSNPHHPQTSYPPYTSPPTNHSPTSTGPLPRTLGSLSSQGPPPSMAPPYPRYQPYSSLPTMAGPVMSNIHQPGSQLSMIPGMVQGYHHTHPMMYAHAQPAPLSERPFKCDQCIQSFSRNHDLKRHKRIHLAVKPFPCSYCSKSFSRKDALKRHRLVKGCETKANENHAAANNNNNSNNNNNNTENAHHFKRDPEDDGAGGRRTP